MPIELARADVEVKVNGVTFTVDAYEANAELAKIDERHSKETMEDDDARWREVQKLVNRIARANWPWILPWKRARCTRKQAINFYREIQIALRRIAEEDAKAAHPFAESPTGTASTPAASENGNSPHGSPTLTDSKPSGS